MTTDPNLDDEALAACATALADGVIDVLPGWVERSVDRVHTAWAGTTPPSLTAAAGQAGRAAVEEVGPRLRRLLDTDIDQQWTNPLSIVRQAVVYPTRVLAEAGVPPVVRDEVAEAQHPDDPYDLTPAAFADLDPRLAEVGLRWGAAKAHVHLRRRRAEGRR